MHKSILLAEKHIRVKSCRHGPMMYNVLDQFVGRSFDRYGEFSDGEANAFAQFVKPGMIVLDVGANIGAHTIFFAKTVGPNGAVLAFEPQRIVHQMLCGNIALNALSHVFAHHMALGREAGSITVPPLDYAQTGNFGGLELSASGSGEVVPVLTLDALELPQCDFIKIDVEGMERDVIAGAARTMARFQPTLYVENDRPHLSAALIELLLGMDYRLYWHCTPLFNPLNFFGEAENVFGSVGSMNMLCLPRASDRVIDGLPEITAPDSDWRTAKPPAR